MARSWQWGPFLFVPFLTTGCFLGYHSSWAQHRQAQQHAVQRSMPQQLPLLQPGATRTAQRVLKVRVYASPDHVASVVDWQKQFSVLVERVNAVLTAGFGAALEVVDVRTFSVRANGEKLEAPLQQLGRGNTAFRGLRG